MADVQPKIKVQIATSELGTDNSDIKLSTSFELKIMGNVQDQNALMGEIKKMIIKHNEKMQGVQSLFPEDAEENNDFPVSRRDKKPEIAGAKTGKGRKGKGK